MKEFPDERVSDVKYSVLGTEELGNFTIYNISHRIQDDVQVYQYYEIKTKLRRILPYIYMPYVLFKPDVTFFEFSVLIIIAPSK
jgi:hypothetical protein